MVEDIGGFLLFQNLSGLHPLNPVLSENIESIIKWR
jgi:hypothetical protein